MEKNNIFDGACFGKPYKTRDARKAIYTMMSCGSHWLAIQDTSFTWEYDNQGKLVSNIDNGMDIISEWKEEINDKELVVNKMNIFDKILQLLISIKQIIVKQ